MTWEYDAASNRYRNADTGRYLSNDQMLGLRDAFLDNQKKYAENLAFEYINGDISKSDWLSKMQEEVGITFIDEYALGKGGRGQLNEDDYVKLSELIDEQFKYLDGFYADLDSMTEEAIAARSNLYIEASTQAYEQAQGKARGVPELEQYPGDGQTACLTNCRCTLEFSETDEGWEVKWVLDYDAEHCEDCQELARSWNPLFIPYEDD